MRFRLLFLLAVIPVLACNAKSDGLSKISVMSYNIRYGEAKDGTNSWQFRYPATAMMIEDQCPDVIGIQEALSYQLLFITENCRDYKCVGVGREDGKSKGEQQSTQINHGALAKQPKTGTHIQAGQFFHSKTPDGAAGGLCKGNFLLNSLNIAFQSLIKSCRQNSFHRTGSLGFAGCQIGSAVGKQQIPAKIKPGH